MDGGGIVITRRRALTVLLFILLIAPIPVMDLANANDPHAPLSTGPNWWWLLIVFVVMGSALRGNRSALGLWAVLSGAIGIALVASGFTVENGAVRFLGGFLALAASIVFALLRRDLAEPAGDGRPASERVGAG
ncbi:MAG TPA: hypothetical protein VHW68_11195 [Actinomycetota bacterium]|jgi:hypothetical protein|nr:hypothetical protein [Actinomycetota bacterium]